MLLLFHRISCPILFAISKFNFADEREKECFPHLHIRDTADHRRDDWTTPRYTTRYDKSDIKQFIPCHRKYSQSECRKAVLYSSVFHRTFLSISTMQPYHSQPSLLTTVFSMAWCKIVMQLFHVVYRWTIPLVTCIFLVYTLA